MRLFAYSSKKMCYVLYLHKLKTSLVHNISTSVLGIETSCDDTGCAVVDIKGKILGESIYSQNAIHIRCGGINPIVAHDLHRDNIELAVDEALKKSLKSIKDIDFIAVTVKPGLKNSLSVGVQYAKYLARKYNKQLIPIHHMEAHALAARMDNDIPFPFLVLLISGGHCLLAVAKDIDDYLLLGQSLDNAPGEVMDKVARRMKLKNLPEYSKLAGGAAIELASKSYNSYNSFEFPLPLAKLRDCNFSFSGLKDSLERKLLKKEIEHEISGNNLIPEVYDLSASFQLALAEHICHRTERGIIYCEKTGLISSMPKSLVISGGVACNNFIYESLKIIGNKHGYKVYRPQPKLCTDNGVMIAWNGIEKLKKNYSIASSLEVKPVAPLGQNIIEEVVAANISVRVTRLKNILKP